jgi:hypothetical protein
MMGKSLLPVLLCAGGGLPRRSSGNHRYVDIISLENLCKAWEEFVLGKKRKLDVQEFSASLFDNIASLHEELEQEVYKHGPYYSFFPTSILTFSISGLNMDFVPSTTSVMPMTLYFYRMTANGWKK